MAATNAPAFKAALVGLLVPALAPVRVDYAYDGRLVEREYVYCGKATGPHQPMAFRNGARLVRLEEFILQLHAEVRKPAATPQDTDARVSQIGQVIEETIAADPQFGGLVPGLMSAFVTDMDLVSGFAEDGVAASALTYQITVKSKLS